MNFQNENSMFKLDMMMMKASYNEWFKQGQWLRYHHHHHQHHHANLHSLSFTKISIVRYVKSFFFLFFISVVIGEKPSSFLSSSSSSPISLLTSFSLSLSFLSPLLFLSFVSIIIFFFINKNEWNKKRGKERAAFFAKIRRQTKKIGKKKERKFIFKLVVAIINDIWLVGRASNCEQLIGWIGQSRFVCVCVYNVPTISSSSPSLSFLCSTTKKKKLKAFYSVLFEKSYIEHKTRAKNNIVY